MIAVDTNILIYAYDDTCPKEQAIATELLADMEEGVLLWQVTCEFLSAARKKLVRTGAEAEVWDRLFTLLQRLQLVLPTPSVLERAEELLRQHQLQFWDAMIYASCLEAGVELLYSQDVPGEAIPGLKIVNPFRS